jgi:hypothetical protein
MKLRVPDSKASFTSSRPIGLDSKTWRYVEPIFEALQHAQHQTERFRFYGYLAAVYRTYALDSKQKSRWSRALEFAALTKTTPDDLPKLFKNSSGIAGCARFAAKQKPKKNAYRDDWA